MIVLISIVLTKYKVRKIQREIEINVKYENHFRIYEKKEKVTINKSNKRLQEIYHSHRTLDRTNPKPNNLLLETVVDINGKKQYSGKQSIENTIDSGDNYIRDGFETITKQLIFDRNEEIINRYITCEKVEPIQLTEPATNELVKTEVVSVKIPIQIQRNRVIAERAESLIEVKTKNEMKTVLDVISYANTSLSVGPQTDTLNLIAVSKPVLTSDSLISNVELSETKV